MTNYREILRLISLGIKQKDEINIYASPQSGINLAGEKHFYALFLER